MKINFTSVRIFQFFLLFVIFVTNSLFVTAQNIQLFTEDFQNGGNSFTINGTGNGSNIGPNKWIINNNYDGTPTYPNTMPQDSTFSGTIGFAPYSYYLHIHDSVSGITNANYNPLAQSDRFAYMTSGLCTYGIDSVHFSFFYLCQGSNTAYGKVYYSKDNGPWTQIGQNLYNNTYKWQFVDIYDPAFSNVGNLRFGFRWENDNSNTAFSESFAIDDIDIVGTYNGNNNPITITITNVIPNPVCQGALLTVFYTISDTLCDGSYIIELSDSTGNFNNSNNAWIFNVYYPQTSGTITVQLNSPPVPPPGTCYKVRISRNSPAPAITGTASVCFEIDDCPNDITTLQPVVTFDTNAVCIGSVIEVPFFATGVYSFNTYTAQLSDSDGTFPITPTVVGSNFDSKTYDPNLPPYKPGTVSGLVPDVPPGCNYYLRVVSSNPAVIGVPWGPFCIGQCDITTNNKQSIQLCVTDCPVDPNGADTTITVDMNYFDSTAVYDTTNQFQIELLDKMFFQPVGNMGALGIVTAINDTLLQIHIPCKDSLGFLGVPPGSYYLRIVATNSSTPDNTLGTLINFTFGAPHAIPPVITSYNYNDFLPEDTFCVGEQVGYYFNPYNYNDKSTYEWQSPQFFGGVPFSWTNVGGDPNSNQNPYIFSLNTPGIIVMRVRETNFGCTATWSVRDTVVFEGPPDITITGPTQICLGDTYHYQVEFFDNTYYTWTATNGTIVDTSNNEIDVVYNGAGNYQLKISAINSCGITNKTKFIQVKAYPTVNAKPDTTICGNQPITLSTTTGSGYYFTWTDGTDTIGTTSSVAVTPDTTTTFYLTVSINAGCKSYDTVKVTALPLPLADAGKDTIVCLTNSITVSTPFSPSYTYSWSDGTSIISTLNSFSFVPSVTFVFYLTVTDTSNCISKDTITISTQPFPSADAGADISICENTSTVLSTFFSADYFYNWSEGTNTIGVSNSVSVSPADTTIYFLAVSDSVGCITNDTITVFTLSYPVAYAGKDTITCLNKSVKLSATSGTNYTYLWSDGTSTVGTADTLVVSPSLNTIYYLTVAGAGNCQSSDTVEVKVEIPVSGSSSDSVCPGGDTALVLSVSGGNSYLWNTGETTSDISVKSIGTFSVTISHPDSVCERTQIFDVLPAPCPTLIIVLPNIFTPNGDGLNNFFTPMVSGNYDSFNIKIYNRWGILVYESNEPFFKWNGNNLKGESANDGVYYYIVEAAYKSDTKKLSGYVNLAR